MRRRYLLHLIMSTVATQLFVGFVNCNVDQHPGPRHEATPPSLGVQIYSYSRLATRAGPIRLKMNGTFTRRRHRQEPMDNIKHISGERIKGKRKQACFILIDLITIITLISYSSNDL